ncbi:MAG: AMP-binding protein, partial [bacterium]|nr:AMP-binding protein [bacterium]
ATVRRLTPWNPGPTLFRTVHQAFGGSLRLCCSGAAPLPLEILHGLEKLGFNVTEAYGLTEASGVSTVNSVSRRRAGTVGPPISQTEVRIANPTPSSGEGEICIRGPVLMRGYFRDKATTSQVIRDGWLHTGDLGRMDRYGYLTVTGRLKELIVTSGGKNVSPPDVERRYSDLPGVAELAVFGLPAKEGYGEEVHAAVVLDPNADPASLQQAVETAVQERASQIPAYMRIQRIHILSEMPKTTTLKVKRGKLKQLAIAPDTAEKSNSLGAPSSAPQDERTQQVLTVVREAMRQTDDTRRVTLDATLQFELGIDSLGLIELAARVESALGVRLDERRLPALYTVADLVQAVKSAPDLKNTSEPLQENGRSEPILPPRGLLARMLLRAFGLLSRGLWKFDVRGLEHIPEQGPFILCPNHESGFDIFLVASCLRPAFQRTLCCFAKREHFEHFGTRLLARLACAIPTDRDGDILPALRSAAKVLAEGRPLLIHPEGTRTRTGQLGSFRRGAARLALETEAPLVPVCIVGAYAIFPIHRPLPRFFNWRRRQRHRLSVIFGPPIYPNNGNQTNITERGLTEHLRRAVQTLGD